MERAKHEFFRNGAEVQKTADIIVDLKRVEKKTIEKWTPAQRQLAADWLNEVERSFRIFKSEILKA
jgi:hypothetical protein